MARLQPHLQIGGPGRRLLFASAGALQAGLIFAAHSNHAMSALGIMDAGDKTLVLPLGGDKNQSDTLLIASVLACSLD